MANPATLRELLIQIDGQGYKAYKQLRGSYAFDDYVLSIDHVQGDPFAAPSRFRVRSGEALAMIFEDIPAIVLSSLIDGAWTAPLPRATPRSTKTPIACGQLQRHHLVAFVGNGSVLPRRSGVEQTPLGGEKTVPFQSPPSLRVSLDAPNAGKIDGMGIPEGVTLVVGGGFHGKSTLLQALQRGVYNHVPGDGRERSSPMRPRSRFELKMDAASRR